MNRYLLILITVFSFISCNTDNSKSELTKIRLNEYSILDRGVLRRFQLFYDSKNKLASENLFYKAYDDEEQLTILNYYYQNDQLDSICRIKNGNIVSYSKFKYNGDTIEENFIIISSSKKYNSIYVKNFSDNIISITDTEFRGDSIYYQSHIIQHWKDNNLVCREVFERYYEQDFHHSMNEFYEYDSLMNPFKQLDEQLFFGSASSSLNNITHKIDVTDNNDTIFWDTYYTFNEFNLPLSSNVKVKFADTTLTIQKTFKYEDFN